MMDHPCYDNAILLKSLKDLPLIMVAQTKYSISIYDIVEDTAVTLAPRASHVYQSTVDTFETLRKMAYCTHSDMTPDGMYEAYRYIVAWTH